MTFRVIVMMTKENIFLNKAHIGIINLYLFLQTYKKIKYYCMQLNNEYDERFKSFI